MFSRHRAALIDYAQRILGNREGAEDVVQDAWLRVAHADGSSTGAMVDRPLGYLYRVVRNRAIDMRRRDMERAPSTAPAQAGSADPSPEAVAADRQALAVMSAALDELPARTRRAVLLHRVDGMRMVEIARELDLSVASVHGLIHDGLAHCRDRLRREGVLPQSIDGDGR
nr:sigma-70 family RNA polymerase sigma factor [Marivibrio halodurans]